MWGFSGSSISGVFLTVFHRKCPLQGGDEGEDHSTTPLSTDSGNHTDSKKSICFYSTSLIGSDVTLTEW